jgi:hypothetical protein
MILFDLLVVYATIMYTNISAIKIHFDILLIF